MKFAYKLQELRKGSGMSQEEFAELLGVSRQSVSKWESGKGYPEIDKLIFISNYFNTSLDLLLKDTTDYSNSNPSLSGSKSVRSSKRSKKKTISLTKSQDTSDFNNQTVYMSDPMPNKKKESYPLRRVSVSSNAQVRPIKNHQFGNKKKKLNILKMGSLMATAIGAICVIVGISISNTNVHYYDDEFYEPIAIAETAIDIVEDYDYYGITWETLYDDDLNSDFENQMMLDINSQYESLLIDADGNVYCTGFDIVVTYSEAQWQMKDELNCILLYQKYCSFKGYNNCNFMELYSVDLEQWIIVNDAMLRVYAEQNYTLEVPEITILDYFDDILNSDVTYYSDWNNAPFEVVFRIDKQSKANVSSNILDLCSSAMSDRKSLSMTEYMSIYEEYNSKYELVNYGNGYNVTFVPKEFVIVSLSDLDE